MITRKWRRITGVLLWLALAGALLLFLWFSADLLYVSTGNATDNATKSDVIIVLGCPTFEGNVVSTTFSACLRSRAHHAAQLYNRGLAPYIVPTGGLTGPPPTEA